MKPDDFIKALTPAAQDTWKRACIPASFSIAQAALESGWGESKLSKEGFNFFGIKATKDWKGEVLIYNTQEFIGGKEVTVSARWRKYSSFADCLKDRELFFKQNPRYAPAFVRGHNIAGACFAQLIFLAGYATDPNYVDKIQSIILKYRLDDLNVLE